MLRASSDAGSSDDGKRIPEIVVEAKKEKVVVDFKNQVARFHATVASLPPVVFVVISLLISFLIRD